MKFEKSKKAYSLVLQAEKNNEDTLKYWVLVDDCVRGIDTADFKLHLSLIDITDKYVSVKENIPITGSSGTLFRYIEPYLKANNVDCSEIYQIFMFQY